MVNIFDVPKSIRSWFSSDEVADELDKMNAWLGIGGENATLIADLLARLELKDVTIDAFNDELKNQLFPLVGEEKTQLAIQDVREKLLNPIKNELISFGIFPPETTYRPGSAAGKPQAEQPATQESPQTFSHVTKHALEQEPEPYLLHKAPMEEEAKESPQLEEKSEHPIQNTTDERAELFSPRFTDSGVEPHFETPRQTRVVNYSALRTPLANPTVEAGPVEKEPPQIHPQNVVNLKKDVENKNNQDDVVKGNTINLKDLPIE